MKDYEVKNEFQNLNFTILNNIEVNISLKIRNLFGGGFAARMNMFKKQASNTSDSQSGVISTGVSMKDRLKLFSNKFPKSENINKPTNKISPKKISLSNELSGKITNNLNLNNNIIQKEKVDEEKNNKKDKKENIIKKDENEKAKLQENKTPKIEEKVVENKIKEKVSKEEISESKKDRSEEKKVEKKEEKKIESLEENNQKENLEVKKNDLLKNEEIKKEQNNEKEKEETIKENKDEEQKQQEKNKEKTEEMKIEKEEKEKKDLKLEENKGKEVKKVIEEKEIKEKNDINDLNNTFTVGKKNYNISTFNKYLDKMGIINTHSDLHKVNSYQNLLNKSSISIKSIKITNLKNSNSNTNFVYKKQNNILIGTKSAMNSPRADNIYKNNLVNNKKWYNNPLLTNKKTQMKTYVHKKFKNIVNNNQLNFTEIKKDNNLIKSNLVIKNSQNVFKNNENLIKQELFKNDNINTISNNKNELEVNKEQNSMKTINKTHLLNLIYSPSSNRNNINVNKLSKINKLNLNPNNNSNQRIIPNPPRIIKTLKNIPIIINPQKELFLGLELSDSNCKFSLINQNPNEIQLINFSEDNNYSIPLIVSFSENKKELKIGQEAQNDIMKNHSKTILKKIK